MSAVEEIKNACMTRLGVAERLELARWLANQDGEWDLEIESDAVAGRLDHLFDEADRDFEAGRCKSL